MGALCLVGSHLGANSRWESDFERAQETFFGLLRMDVSAEREAWVSVTETAANVGYGRPTRDEERPVGVAEEVRA